MPSVTKPNSFTQPDQFNTRKLNCYTISCANVHVNYDLADSDFHKVVRAIQQYASVEILGVPSAGTFRIGITGNEDGVHPVDADLTAAKTGASQLATVAAFVF
jgi:hypothetical protein